MNKLVLATFLFTFLLSCSNISNQPEFEKRFFSDKSFWNQPIGENPEIDARSDEWIALMKTEPNTPNIGINASQWTIPVYEVDDSTPVYT
ncbi:MAG: hypothetical protein GF353_20880, partial [Candidatus Lokiarchaeota archaeon]|nr:hypothetical protein [Candidatus Lokiarchaeota archaeon]